MNLRSIPSVQLVVIRGQLAGVMIRVAGPRFLIGRSEECHLRPRNAEVSRRHAEILLGTDGVFVRDLGSRNGTLVNGEPVAEPVPLRDGDVLMLGPLGFTVLIQGHPETPPDGTLSDHAVSTWPVDADEESVGQADAYAAATSENAATPGR